MIYLAVFWILTVALIILFLLRYIAQIRNSHLDGLITILGITAFAFLIMGILTKDPLFSTLGIPKEYEWLAGLIISGFTLWKSYLNPLKDRVIKTEIKVSSIDTSIHSIKNDVETIKDTLLNERNKA